MNRRIPSLKIGMFAVILAVACSMAFSATAFAASSTWPVPRSPMTNTATADDGTVKTVVTASANGCYRTFPEILGLSNPLCNPGNGASQTDPSAALTAMQTDPDYGLYGSPANNSPDAYMWNYYYNFYANAFGLTLADPDVTCITCNDRAAGINQAPVAAYGGVCAAFYHRPDIAYGLGTVGADGAATAYATYVQLINSFTPDQEWYHEGDATYNPELIDCRGEYGAKLFHISTLYDLAQAAQNTIEKSGNTKTTRYGDDPYKYAVEFEKLVRGTNYAVMKAIAEGQTTRKTVAYVNTVDTETKALQLTVTDPSVASFEEMYQNVASWGGTCIRYMYAPNILECVTNNIGEVNKLTVDEQNLYVASVKDLAACDAIMVRTGNGMGDCNADADKIRQLFLEAGYSEADIPPMYYAYPTFPGGGGGNYAYVSYYPTMISFVYPEVLNPSYIDAYYCETVYHVASTYLEDAMNILFAKASRPAGYEIDLSGYSYDAMSEKLNSGLRYYMGHEAEIDAKYPTMIMTDYLKAHVEQYAPGIDGAVVTLSQDTFTYTGEAFQPAVTVTFDGKELVEGTDYQVAYSDNVNAGTAKVTVTGAGSYDGSTGTTFTIEKADATITAKNVKVKVGKSTQIDATTTGGDLSYSVNKKAKKAGVTVNAKGKVTAKKNAKVGTYKVSIKSAATDNFNEASKKIKVKVKK